MLTCKTFFEKIRKKAAGFFGGESGQSLVVAALAFTVILGGAALAVDLGASYTAQQKLQNAADEAALAAARKICESSADTSAARRAALDIAELNGAERENTTVTVPYQGDKYKIEVICTREMDYSFAGVLGKDKGTVSARAVAQCEPLRGPFDYAIFSGNKNYELQLNTGNMIVNGDIHSNDNMAMNSGGLVVNGNAETVNRLAVRSNNITINGECIAARTERNGTTVTAPNGPLVDMPDFTDIVKKAAQQAGTYYSKSQNFYGDGIHIDGAIFVNGDVTFSAPTVISGSGIILATGSIQFNTDSVRADNPVCFYSKTGNISAWVSTLEVDGLLYAPNGTIQTGADVIVNGRVVADKVMMNGSKVRINCGEHDRDCLPRLEIALIE